MGLLNFLQPVQVGQAPQLLQPTGKSCLERRTRQLSQGRFFPGTSESLRTSAEIPTGEAQNVLIPEKTCPAETAVPHGKWRHWPTWGAGMCQHVHDTKELRMCGTGVLCCLHLKCWEADTQAFFQYLPVAIMLMENSNFHCSRDCHSFRHGSK